MSAIAIYHSSRFGQAQRIAQVVAEEIHAQGLDARCASLNSDATPELAQQPEFPAAIVLIASIRYGHFAPEVERFVAANLTALQNTPSAFASVSLTARKPEKNTPQTHPYTRKFLTRMAEKGWQPQHPAVFAGALRYPLYNWLDKTMIRLIMCITGGPTDPITDTEYTNWEQVRQWARTIASVARA